MIELKKITDLIENGLNAISTDREFVIFPNLGELKKDYKEDNSNKVNRYINGDASVVASNIVPVRNLQVYTQTIRVEMVLPYERLGKDENGNFIEVLNITRLLNQYISSVNTVPISINENGKTIEITPQYSGVSVGTIEQMSPFGNILPIYLDGVFTFVESGVNTNNISLLVNGENMYFDRYSSSRVRVVETNMIANEKSTKSLAQSNGLSLTIEMPLLTSEQAQKIEEDLWNGTMNKAYCIERLKGTATGNTNGAYIMILGEAQETGSVGQNIGYKVSFVEGKADNLVYDNNWVEIDATTTTPNEEYTLDFTQAMLDKRITIFWGDGQNDSLKALQSVPHFWHTYTQAGNYKIRVFIGG